MKAFRIFLYDATESLRYDLLRKNPGSLSSSSPVKQRTELVKRIDDTSRDNFKPSTIPREENTFVPEKNKEDFFSLIKTWKSRVKLGSEYTIPELEAEEKSPINPRVCVRSDPFHGFCWATRDMFKHSYEGSRDEAGQFHGEGSVSLQDGGEITGSWWKGFRSGKCSITNNFGGLRLKGTFKNGRMCGKGIIIRDNFTVEGYFRDGCLHGLCSIEDLMDNLFIGRFNSGHPTGHWWQFIKSGGHLIGELEMTEAGVSIGGLDCVYLYPDCVSALAGEFQHSQLVRARSATVEEATVNRGVCQIRFMFENCNSLLGLGISGYQTQKGLSWSEKHLHGIEFAASL